MQRKTADWDASLGHSTSLTMLRWARMTPLKKECSMSTMSWKLLLFYSCVSSWRPYDKFNSNCFIEVLVIFQGNKVGSSKVSVNCKLPYTLTSTISGRWNFLFICISWYEKKNPTEITERVIWNCLIIDSFTSSILCPKIMKFSSIASVKQSMMC